MELMKHKILKTRTGEVSLGDDGIYRQKMFQNVHVDLEDAKELFARNEELSDGTTRPLLVMVGGTRSLSREARSFFAGKESARLFSAVALLVDSQLTRVISNFFIGLNKPFFPVKIFSSEKEALEWLKGYLK